MEPIKFGPQSIMGGGASAPAPVTTGLKVTGSVQQTQNTGLGHTFYAGGMDRAPALAMPEFLSGIFAQEREAAKQAAMFEGFASAVQGETLESIQKDTPWYARPFGATHFKTGAMMYETMQRQTQLASEWQQQMPELRKEGPDQIRKHLMGTMQEALTGDPMTDMVMQKSMMEQFAPLLEQHTREHTAWNNANMIRAQVDAAASQQSVFQKAMADAARLGQDVQEPQMLALNAALNSLRERWQVLKYQTDDSAKQFIQTTLSAAIRKGEFYVVEAAVRDGVLDAMDADDRERFMAQYTSGQQAYKARFPLDNEGFNKHLAEVQAMKAMGVPALRLREHMEAADRYYSAETGSPSGWFTSSEYESYTGQAMSNHLAADERARARAEREAERLQARRDKLDEEQAKAEAKARTTQDIQRAFVSGRASDYLGNPEIPQNELYYVTSETYDNLVSTGQAAKAVGMLVGNYNNSSSAFVIPRLRERFQTATKAAVGVDYSDSFDQVFAQWDAIRNSPVMRFDHDSGEFVQDDTSSGRAAAVAYFGETVNDKFAEFSALVESGHLTRHQAYTAVFRPWAESGHPDMTSPNMNAKAMKAEYTAGLEAMDTTMFSRFMTGSGFALHPSAREQLAAIVPSSWNSLGDMIPERRAAEASKLALVKHGKRIIGGHMVPDRPGTRGMMEYLGDPDGSVTGTLLNRHFENVWSKNGYGDIKRSDIQIYPTEAINGAPAYIVRAVVDSGWEAFTFSAADLDALRTADWQAKTERDQGIAASREANRTSQVQSTDGGTPLGVTVIPEAARDAHLDAYTGKTKEQRDAEAAANRAKLTRAASYLINPVGAAILQYNDKE